MLACVFLGALRPDDGSVKPEPLNEAGTLVSSDETFVSVNTGKQALKYTVSPEPQEDELIALPEPRTEQWTQRWQLGYPYYVCLIDYEDKPTEVLVPTEFYEIRDSTMAAYTPD